MQRWIRRERLPDKDRHVRLLWIHPWSQRSLRRGEFRIWSRSESHRWSYLQDLWFPWRERSVRQQAARRSWSVHAQVPALWALKMQLQGELPVWSIPVQLDLLIKSGDCRRNRWWWPCSMRLRKEHLRAPEEPESHRDRSHTLRSPGGIRKFPSDNG